MRGRIDGDRLADRQRGPAWAAGRGDREAEDVFLQLVDRFRHTVQIRLLGIVLGRVAGKLLGEEQVVEVGLQVLAVGMARFEFFHCRQNTLPGGANPGQQVGIARRELVALFDRREHGCGQRLGPLVGRAGLGFAEVIMSP